MKNTFFIVGPTAVGKTSIAVNLAEQFDAEIVNADAFQLYRGLDILTAKPDGHAQHHVRHHLLSQVGPEEPMSAAKFAELASVAVADIMSRTKKAIVVGGSGLYIKAIMQGFDPVPPADPSLREELAKVSLEELRQRLNKLNPELAARTDLKNPRRVVRAIEIASATTVVPSKAQASGSENLRITPCDPPTEARDKELTGVLLVRDRHDLYERINERVNAMFRQGVEEEVGALQNVGPTAAKALGFHEIRALIGGKISREDCIAKIQQATRRYAKRQLTWFRHQSNFPQLNLTSFSQPEAVRAIMQILHHRAQE